MVCAPARRLLQHYPGVQDIEVAHKALPEVFGLVVQRQAEVTGAPQPVLDLSFCHSVMTSITNSALQLRRADDALIAGNFEASRGIAIEALANAEGFKDLLAEAKALCILADRDRLASKYRRAHDSSQRAALLFRLVGDVEGEVAALTILSHVAANLGRSEDAIEAALLSARLVERMTHHEAEEISACSSHHRSEPRYPTGNLLYQHYVTLPKPLFTLIGNPMKKLLIVVALLSASQTVPALDAWDSTKDYANKAMFWKDGSLKSLSFESVFHKPIYQKNYFGIALTGATIIGAGAFTYFTAGAGAPVAATGVGTVATWVGGGSAGAYMAGLSTIGGWFGGNAILGAAVLNGISIGVVGGGASFASLPAIGKVGVMASVTASALDGVALYQNPDTKNLTYRIHLTVPEDLGSKQVLALTKQLRDVEVKLLNADAHKNEKTFLDLVKKKDALLVDAVAKGQAALKDGARNEDLLVLGVIAQNAGASDLFENLVKTINVNKMEDTGYVDYLKAVASIERGDTESGTTQVRKSWRLNPYAVEPPLLLINILAHEKFDAKEEEIRAIVETASRDFNSNKYKPSYSLVSLDYRLATMYLVNKKYSLAQIYYEKAYEELSLLQKHLGSKQMKSMIRLGIANAMFGDNKTAQAQLLLLEILEDVKTDAEKNFIKSQYAGNF